MDKIYTKRFCKRCAQMVIRLREKPIMIRWSGKIEKRFTNSKLHQLTAVIGISKHKKLGTYVSMLFNRNRMLVFERRRYYFLSA